MVSMTLNAPQPGIYLIRNLWSACIMDLAYDHGIVIGWAEHGGLNQRWIVKQGKKPNTVTVQSAVNHSYLACDVSSGVHVQEDYTEWAFTSVGDGAYRFQTAHHVACLQSKIEGEAVTLLPAAKVRFRKGDWKLKKL